MLRFCSLGSGSEGNALLIEASEGLFATRMLVDNGFGPRQLDERLGRLGLTVDDLDAVFVTHEHSDHVGGVSALLKRRSLALLCSAGTRNAAGLICAEVDWRRVRDGAAITVGAMQVLPLAVPHDAAEPLQLVVTDGDRRLGVLTDIGVPTTAVARAFDGLNAMLIECNHDPELLRNGAYPPFLKARIAGDRGHLSNAQAAQLLDSIDRSRLNRVVAAHLSRQNNRPALARAALASVLGCADEHVIVADQSQGCRWISA
ncbi:MAG: MBL fold metallo-hydrolase [Betaproteobacteria bacterium]